MDQRAGAAQRAGGDDPPAPAAVLVLEPDPESAAEFRRVLGGEPETADTECGIPVQTCLDAPARRFRLTLCSYAGAAARASSDAAARGEAFAVAFLDHAACRGGAGAALLRQIRQEHRGLRVVFTGRSSSDVDGARAPDGATALLRKPLDADELRALGGALARGHRVQAERDLALARLDVASRIGGIAHWEWNPHAERARWCREFARLTGLSAIQRTGAADMVWERIHPEDRLRVRAHMSRAAHEDGARALDYRIHHPANGVRRLRQESVACHVPGSVSSWTVSAVQDVTERSGVEDTIRRLAYYDPLTGLPNRSFLSEHLRNVLTAARRHDRTAAVLHVDLDSFKRVNDTLGHGAGDRLLQEAASRLQGCVRDNDCVAREQGGDLWPPAGAPGTTALDAAPGTVTRFGADEFIVVLSEVDSADDPVRVARRIVASLGEPVVLDGRDVAVGASVGIAVFPDHADSEDALLRNAALAMDAAKRRGRNQVESFHACLLSPGVDRLNLEASLRHALESGGLAMHYQPKVDAGDGRLAGAEALLRWHHPELGMIPPCDFIPIAEETGLILPLGEWVVREVCAQIGAWRARDLTSVPVSINVSAQQLRDHALARKIGRELERAGLEPAALEFEITESVLMDETGAGEARLRELQALGSQVSMDDFGTGYSSLSYLKRLPIDVVKIDRSFVRDILDEADDQAILRAIITMAHQLRLRIVAEGVESEAQMRLLQEMDCDLIQGYVISPPLPADEFATRFLSTCQRMAV